MNEPGEPVEPARALAGLAPDGARLDVYCTPDDISDDPPFTCDLLLRIPDRVSLTDAAAWWYKVAAAVAVRSAVFEHEGTRFRYRRVVPYLHTTDGGYAPAGWSCPEDASLSENKAARVMGTREPPGGAFRSPEAAGTAGCQLAIVPTRHQEPSRDDDET